MVLHLQMHMFTIRFTTHREFVHSVKFYVKTTKYFFFSEFRNTFYLLGYTDLCNNDILYGAFSGDINVPGLTDLCSTSSKYLIHNSVQSLYRLSGLVSVLHTLQYCVCVCVFVCARGSYSHIHSKDFKSLDWVVTAYPGGTVDRIWFFIAMKTSPHFTAYTPMVVCMDFVELKNQNT